MLISIQTYDASFYSFIHIFTCLFIESIVIYWCDSTLNPNGGSEISSDYFQNRQIYTLEDSSPVNLQWIQTKYIQFSSVQFSRSVVSDSLQPLEPQHARPPCPSPTPEIDPNPCPLSQ